MKIFLIIFDTLRKDHTGKTYGNDWIKTPHFDAFAKDSIVFDKAYPESLPTIPMRRSTHTGIRTFPFNHKRPALRTDDMVQTPGWHPIPPNHIQIAEYMKRNGYVTSFVTSTYHQFKPNMNFHLGFDEWHYIRGHEFDKYRARVRMRKSAFDRIIRNHLVKTKVHRGAVQLQKLLLEQYFRNIHDRKTEEEYFPAKTFKKAIKFAENTKRISNTFCLIDEFDPHEPWDPPQRYYDLYADKNYTGNKIIHPIYNESIDYLSEDELKSMRACYAGEVSMCDDWFGFFLNRLKELEFYDDSLIIFISDHGHVIGEHNATGKIPMFMYPELIDLPFIIKPPGGINGPKRIRKPYIYNHDILPTIFGFFGKEKPEIFDGLDLSGFIYEEDHELENRDYITCGMNLCTVYKDDKYALITSNDKSRQKLFDLSKDPGWNENIASDNPDICEELFKKIEDDAKGDLPLETEKSYIDELKDWYYQSALKKEIDD